jgi:Ca-activated chloride channel family protein
MSVFLLIFALLLPQSGTAQQQSAAGNSDSTVELDATLVEVPVVVSEPGGRYVTDLRESDFTLLEDGVAQKISFFAPVEEPFDVALVLDCSGSTREKLASIREAASAFLDQLRPSDRVALVTFDDEVRVLSTLTSDRDVLRRAIAGIETGAYSQVYEAVHTATRDVLGASERRKAAIFFTDGVDTASAVATFDDTLAEVAQAQIIVYPIRYATRADMETRQGLAPRDVAGQNVESRPRSVVKLERSRQELADAYRIADAYLHELAERSGGVLHRADTIGDLGPALARIADELRHQYLLGYYPEKRGLDESSRMISVRVSRPSLTVRARQGYRLYRRK